MNLFKIANENTDYLLEKYSFINKRFNEENKLVLIREFVELIKTKWHLSINLKIHDISLFLIEGQYKNKYEIESENEDYIKIKYLKYKSKNLKFAELDKKRNILDSLIDDGKQNKYMGLNIGGLGITKFGNFCLIIKRKYALNYKSIAFLKEDSLNYFYGNGKIDIKKLKREISNRKFVHVLALIKHENNISEEFIRKCHDLICCNENYIESITQDNINIGHIGWVKISQIDYDSYFSINLYSENISENAFERIRAYMFLGILKLLNKYGIKLEKVNKNEY